MEYIKKSLSKPTDWLLLGVVICLIVLVFYNRTVEHLDEEDNEPPPSTDIPSIPKVNVQVNELPVSQEALRQAIGEVYRADISAIKNLSDIANALQKGNGIKIPGKLVVNGETDLVGSKLTVAGETSLKNKLTVDGESSLKSKLTVDGETSLKSDLTVGGKLNVTGATNLASLTASQYVATDSNKNLVSSVLPSSIISYSIIGGTGGYTLVPQGNPTKVKIEGNESPVKNGIKRENDKLINISGKSVSCLVMYGGQARVEMNSYVQLELWLDGNNLNQNVYAGGNGNLRLDSTHPSASSIVLLNPNSYIEFYVSGKGGFENAFQGLNVTIIGLF